MANLMPMFDVLGEDLTEFSDLLSSYYTKSYQNNIDISECHIN